MAFNAAKINPPPMHQRFCVAVGRGHGPGGGGFIWEEAEEFSPEELVLFAENAVYPCYQRLMELAKRQGPKDTEFVPVIRPRITPTISLSSVLMSFATINPRMTAVGNTRPTTNATINPQISSRRRSAT